MEEYEGDLICPYCGYRQDTPPKEAYHIVPGTIVRNRYQMGRVLGSGGFGITYIAYDIVLQKKVAIKEYLPTEFATRMPNETRVSVYAGEKEEQFNAGMKKSLDEAKRLAEFQQTPGITQIYDFFEENNTAYIVMEMLEGETLKDRLKRVGKMSVEEALPIILSVLSALKEVHAKNIIHRDLAPDNIFLLNTGEVKLLDFGASRQVTTTHSKSLTVILKLGYAPVEQYQSGGNQGPWTDVYALAATFYKMITGIRPPQSPERRMNDTLKEPSKLGIPIDKNVENALMNALHVRLEDRTQSAEEFEAALYSSDVQRTEATVEKHDMGKWPLWLKLVCGAVATAVAVFAILLATGVIRFQAPALPSFQQSEGTVWMPNLVNMKEENARNLLEQMGLKFEIGGLEASDTILEGYILRQTDADGNEIRPGEAVEEGETIQVVISTGNGKAVVPDILWMSQKDAEKRLGEMGLFCNVEMDPQAWAGEDIVCGVEPQPGSEIQRDAVITLKVAAGAQVSSDMLVEVPDLTGLDQQEAGALLKESGLFMQKIELEHRRDMAAGQIVSQDIRPGADASQGITVRVHVSAGPRTVALVSVVNMTQQDALEVLDTLGLEAAVSEEYSDTVEAGIIIAQSIEPGTVEEGTPITLTVSLGAAPAVNTQENRRQTQPRAQQPAAQQPPTQAPQPTQAPPPTQAPAPESAPAAVDSDTDW